MATDGGSPDITPSPDDSGRLSLQGSESGGRNVPGQIPVELRAVAENLGIKLIPERDWAERERVYGSVKHGSVAQKLAEYDKFVETDKKRKDGELSDLERTTGEAKTLREQNETLAVENRELALRVGFLSENAKLAIDPKAVAVIPEIMETSWSILGEFKGGDETAVGEFVKGGLEKMLGIQSRLARQLGGGEPANAPGGGSPADPSGAQSEPLPRRQGSVVKEAMDWKRAVAFTQHPHIVSPTRGGKER